MSHLKMTINARKSWKLMTAHSHAKTVANIIPKNLVIYIVGNHFHVLCISSDSGHLERGILNVFSNSFHSFQNKNTSVSMQFKATSNWYQSASASREVVVYSAPSWSLFVPQENLTAKQLLFTLPMQPRRCFGSRHRRRNLLSLAGGCFDGAI